MNDHDEIETERLLLRRLAPGHAGALHEIYADGAAMRFWHEPPHRHEDQTRAMVERFIAGTERAWVLCRKPGEEAIGLVYYLGINNGHAGLGYILAPRCWGQGLMTEAVRGALGHGFPHLGVDRVELWIDARNLGSQGVAARTGFKRRGVFRQKYPHEAQSHETLVYGLRIDEWRAGSTLRNPPTIEAYSLHPILVVPDVKATAQYYRDMLGFAIAFLDGNPPTYGAVSLGEWAAAGVSVHFSKADAASPAGIALYLNVGPELDRLCEIYRARGVDLVGDVVHQPWGARELALRDCNGYLLRFSTPA
jgi:RimJ/RimL family protein N-acetyltransferase/catechol 2,3-dioxygenase-like lactoylglutathione lyase family enzyme